MRLTKLKLAGFKSFVDPTTIALPGQLVGVVGPNGCGKSNVMDAVRWAGSSRRLTQVAGSVSSAQPAVVAAVPRTPARTRAWVARGMATAVERAATNEAV